MRPRIIVLFFEAPRHRRNRKEGLGFAFMRNKTMRNKTGAIILSILFLVLMSVAMPVAAAPVKTVAEATPPPQRVLIKNVSIFNGTDLLFSYEGRKQQLHGMTLRKQWFDSADIMIQATGTNGEIVGLTGQRNPYGKVGVIEAGAMADVLIYSKNPLKDVAVVEDHENNLKLIIKNGKIYKNVL